MPLSLPRSAPADETPAVNRKSVPAVQNRFLLPAPWTNGTIRGTGIPEKDIPSSHRIPKLPFFPLVSQFITHMQYQQTGCGIYLYFSDILLQGDASMKQLCGFSAGAGSCGGLIVCPRHRFRSEQASVRYRTGSLVQQRCTPFVYFTNQL